MANLEAIDLQPGDRYKGEALVGSNNNLVVDEVEIRVTSIEGNRVKFTCTDTKPEGEPKLEYKYDAAVEEFINGHFGIYDLTKLSPPPVPWRAYKRLAGRG